MALCCAEAPLTQASKTTHKKKKKFILCAGKELLLASVKTVIHRGYAGEEGVLWVNWGGAHNATQTYKSAFSEGLCMRRTVLTAGGWLVGCFGAQPMVPWWGGAADRRDMYIGYIGCGGGGLKVLSWPALALLAVTMPDQQAMCHCTSSGCKELGFMQALPQRLKQVSWFLGFS